MTIQLQWRHCGVSIIDDTGRTMTRSKIGALLLASSVCGAFNAPVAAQPYPSQPVKVISDSSAGSAPDVILRA